MPGRVSGLQVTAGRSWGRQWVRTVRGASSRQGLGPKSQCLQAVGGSVAFHDQASEGADTACAWRRNTTCLSRGWGARIWGHDLKLPDPRVSNR